MSEPHTLAKSQMTVNRYQLLQQLEWSRDLETQSGPIIKLSLRTGHKCYPPLIWLAPKGSKVPGITPRPWHGSILEEEPDLCCLGAEPIEVSR